MISLHWMIFVGIALTVLPISLLYKDGKSDFTGLCFTIQITAAVVIFVIGFLLSVPGIVE